MSFPPNLTAYKRTSTFEEDSIPAGLLRDHQTKSGVWGRIVVELGLLRFHRPDGTVQDLAPGTDGVIPPQALHSVEAIGPVRFYVEFLRE